MEQYRLTTANGLVIDFETPKSEMKNYVENSAYFNNVKWATDKVFELYHRDSVMDVGIIYDLDVIPDRQCASGADLYRYSELLIKHIDDVSFEI